MNFAAQDQVYVLAKSVDTLRVKLCEAVEHHDAHVMACPDCNLTHRCADAALLAAVVRDLTADHAMSLEAWRHAKYGSEATS